jgi:hypothetical protein
MGWSDRRLILRVASHTRIMALESSTQDSVTLRTLLVATCFALLCITPTSAFAQQARDLWLPSVADDSEVTLAEVEQVFGEVLSGSTDGHIVGRDGLVSVIASEGLELPRCLEGLDACGSAAEAAARSVGIARVIRVAVYEEGARLELEVRDLPLGRVTVARATSEGLRETVYAAIAEVTGLTGTLSIQSTPSGARVLLDGQLLGVTPYESTLSIGAYTLALELDAYAPHGQNIEVRAGERRRLEVDLQREAADVTVQSNAPDALLYLDGAQVGEPLDRVFAMDPGERRVVVRAPGYEDAELLLTLRAGEEREVTLTMQKTQATLDAERRAAIGSRPVVVELSMVGQNLRTDWEGGRAPVGGDTRRVRCLLSDETGGCRGNAPVGLLGLETSLMYHWHWVELELLGLSVQRARLRGNDRQYALNGTTARVDAQSGTAVGLRLPHVGARWLITPYWEVFGRTGPTVVVHRLPGTIDPSEASTRIRRTSVVWDVRLGGRYHIGERWFAVGSLDVGFDTNNSDSGVRFGGTLGLGLRFGDPLNIDDRLNRRFRRERTSAPRGMEEL